MVCSWKQHIVFAACQRFRENSYKNILNNSTIKISINAINGMQITKTAKPITDSNKVKDIVDKFKSKYGSSEVKKYYTKLNVAVEVALQQE